MASRLESRKSLLRGDPGFSQYNSHNSHYNPQMPYDEDYDKQPHHPPNAHTYPQAQVDYGAADAQPGYSQPAAFTQQGLSQSAYADNADASEFDARQGYAQREGFGHSAPPPKTTVSKFAFLKSKWPATFMALTCLQAIVCLCFEAYTFAKFESKVGSGNPKQHDVESQKKTIPTFLTLFIFGFLYELVIVWDALRMKNTIQIIGVCIANLALMVYTTIQVDQIREALNVLEEYNALEPGTTADMVWDKVEPFLVAIPAVLAAVTVCMGFITWKLYQKFAWDILKNIGADYRMKKRFLHYQIYIALLKFDFFFFLGFIIQFVVIVTQISHPEFALTIATIPITIIILLAAAFFVRRESKVGMVVIIFLYFGGLSYFVFKLVRIYEPGYKHFYAAVQKSLAAFAVITILLIILTIVNAIMCMCNFNAGLKDHLVRKSKRKSEEEPDLNSINLTDAKPQLPSRMTID